MLIGINLLGIGLCAAGIAGRFHYMFKEDEEGDQKPEDYNATIFFMSTMFFIIFAVMHALSLISADNTAGRFVRGNFHFLDYYLGRGIFLFFIALFLLETPNALEVILFSAICVVVIIDIVVGVAEVNVRKAMATASADAQQFANK